MPVLRPVPSSTPSLPFAFAFAFAGLLGLGCAAEPGADASSDQAPDLTQLCTPNLAAELPGDVPFGADDEAFDCYSWQTFMALNRPTDHDGHADPQRAVADELPDASTPTVWDDWSNTADIASPTEPRWRETYIPPACAELMDDADILLMQPGDNAETATGLNMATALDGLPVSDRNGHAIRFEVTLNQTTFDWTASRGLGTRAGQGMYGDVAMPCATDEDPDGTMTIKSAWMILDEEQRASGRYYTRQAAVYIQPSMNSAAAGIEDPGPSEAGCELHTVGLVGMNIGRKTLQQPRWIWSNFEHVDNAPDCEPGGTTDCSPGGVWATPPSEFAKRFDNLSPNDCPHVVNRDYNFLSATAAVGQGCDCNIPPPSNVSDADDDFIRYYVDEASALEPAKVCRAAPIPAATAELNARWHAALGDSVWSNYVLVGTQWYDWGDEAKLACETPYVEVLADANAPVGGGKIPDEDADGVAPEILANTSMETWSQSSSSCLSCHSGAFMGGEDPNGQHRSADFSWWLNAAINR